jgi:hypothetical protein
MTLQATWCAIMWSEPSFVPPVYLYVTAIFTVEDLELVA